MKQIDSKNLHRLPEKNQAEAERLYGSLATTIASIEKEISNLSSQAQKELGQV
ncbi:MAG: hypothetical protein HYZ69_03110 [Candidatus Colwellbacteria bacterium]|nr:hypothetical protein [Candidatus Colwellbacteria bacterium]